jgi:lysylphosphatidylglycerol synthetase-like protein (DUF2156 family)
VADNPYQAPKSTVRDIVLPLSIPPEIAKHIKNAWVAACIFGAITLVVALLAIAWTRLIDVALIFGLALGIYKKSRTCAILMLVYFIVSNIMLYHKNSDPSRIVMAVIFIYYFWFGIVGTFRYHTFIREQKRATATSI